LVATIIAEVQLLTYEDEALKFWKAREQVTIKIFETS